MPNITESNKTVVIRSEVETKKNYHDYREILRFDFWYSCAYCSLTEAEGGGIGFEIDHYYPQKKQPNLINDYKNLMWSCEICNRYKSDYLPDEEDEKKGNIVIKPDEDDPSNHLLVNENRFEKKTHTGEFNIHLLDLNRQQLRRLRDIRNRLLEANNFVAFGVRKLISKRVDEISSNKRFLFLQIKKKMIEQHNYLSDNLESLIKNFARSPMIDIDEEKQERIKTRKKYLKNQKAITFSAD